jgi:Tat protein secretion system quality control protein TatD with DNase activity
MMRRQASRAGCLLTRSLGGARRPSKARPSRNEPALLPFVLARVAEARGQSAEHVAAVSTANARRLFGLAA